MKKTRSKKSCDTVPLNQCRSRLSGGNAQIYQEKLFFLPLKGFTDKNILWDSRSGTTPCQACWANEETIFCTGPSRTTKEGQKSLVPAWRAQKANQRRTPYIVLLESPFASVSTVSRGHPSLVSRWHFSGGGGIWSLKNQGWAKLVLIALERYIVALKRLTFNLR